MKKILCVIFVSLFLVNFIGAGVVKKEKVEVNLGKFGTFTSLQSTKIEGLKKATDSESEFKGKSLLGKMAGKLVLRSGSFGEIIDLSEMMTYNLDHKNKTFTQSPLEKFQAEERGGQVPREEQAEEKGESHIKIVRNEFKVDETGETKVINQFESTEYIITWITEWEDTQTGEKGTTRLLTTVWTTPLSNDMKLCRDEEANFSREYMQKMGLSADELQQQILGAQWQSFFAQMDTSGKSSTYDASPFTAEMEKIKGYPVVIDGKYYTTRPERETQTEQEESPGVRKVLGKLAKKVLTKKTEEKSEEAPSFTYYVELIALSPETVEANALQVPANYKKKD